MFECVALLIGFFTFVVYCVLPKSETVSGCRTQAERRKGGSRREARRRRAGRARRVNFEGESFILCEGVISRATPTSRTIEQEVKQNPYTKLCKAYNRMINDVKYNTVLSTGKHLGLSRDETKAVRLYTMDSIGLFNELNTALREGEDKYPVLHYWLQSAIAKLKVKTPPTVLYRGYKTRVNVKVGTTLPLPGFSSASTDLNVAMFEFSSPGCTILQFDSSRQGASVSSLSEYEYEKEVVIPPTEKFKVYGESFEGEYHFIYLKPSPVGKRYI